MVLIIVIVIGSLLLVTILITLVYIVRKLLRLRQNVSVIPAASIFAGRGREKKEFTQVELDFYFPPVPFGLLLQLNR